jgi:Pyruvate/2-oxoacid:ferredoxin oxidoreductase delta subunit
VADIIDLEKRRQHQENDKANALRREKIDVLKKVLQCARCQLKCSRCGVQIDESDQNNEPKLPYPLCSGCGDEYEAYLKLRSGEFAERYWYNEEWMEVWQTWLKHQKALDQYRDSQEFIKLLRELESLW